MGLALDRYLARTGRPTTTTLEAVFSRWDEVVGPQVAAHARPVSVERHTLIVGVDAPAWATQLTFLASTLMARLEELVGPGVITSVDVRVRPPKRNF